MKWLHTAAIYIILCYNNKASERVGSLIPASQQGRNVGKVFNPVVKLVLENQPFLMPEPAEKPSFHNKACLESQTATLPPVTQIILCHLAER